MGKILIYLFINLSNLKKKLTFCPLLVNMILFLLKKNLYLINYNKFLESGTLCYKNVLDGKRTNRGTTGYRDRICTQQKMFIAS